MAAYGVLVATVAVLVCQVSAQLCNRPTITNPGLPLLQQLQQISQVPSAVPNLFPLSNGLYYNPNVNPTPVISTTLVDNSVANSLANTLQLLIVSELLESSLNPTPTASPLVSNVVPLYDAIGTIGTTASPLEVLTPTVDVTTVNYGPVVDVSTVVTDVVTAAPIVPIVEVQAPIATSLVTEVVSPVTTYSSQSIYAPVTEVIAPAPVTSTVTNVYGSVLQGQVPLVTEVTSSIAPVPSVDVYTTINDVNTISVVNTPVNPYYVQSPTYVTEVTEVVAPVQVSAPVVDIPYLQLPCPLSFAPIDVAAPVSFISDYYAGYADVVTPVPSTVPFPAEIILPQSIPAQIRCNFGYSPLNIPYLNLNVEPVSPCSGFVY